MEVLESKQDILGGAVTDGTRRKRALVPGCGMGYDVYLFAAYGYDAFGLEGSANAVKAAEGFGADAEKRLEYAAKNGEVGKGAVKFVHGDFYTEEWEKEVGGSFDVIYDYTVSLISRAIADC